MCRCPASKATADIVKLESQHAGQRKCRCSEIRIWILRRKLAQLTTRFLNSFVLARRARSNTCRTDHVRHTICHVDYSRRHPSGITPKPVTRTRRAQFRSVGFERGHRAYRRQCQQAPQTDIQPTLLRPSQAQICPRSYSE